MSNTSKAKTASRQSTFTWNTARRNPWSTFGRFRDVRNKAELPVDDGPFSRCFLCLHRFVDDDSVYICIGVWQDEEARGNLFMCDKCWKKNLEE